MYDYIRTYQLDKLRDEINEFKTNPNQTIGYPKDFNLVEKLKQAGKMSEYESEGKRYSDFYKRVMNRVHVDYEENRKLLIKEELVKLKDEVNADDSIELTVSEIEELIKIIDDIIKEDSVESFKEKK